MCLYRIVTGGQIGVDRAAMRAAVRVGLDVEGFLPPGRTSESGPLAAEDFPRFREIDRAAVGAVRDAEVHRFYGTSGGVELESRRGRIARTRANVAMSDATLVVRPRGREPADPGTGVCLDWARQLGRPVWDSSEEDKGLRPEAIAAWILRERIGILNVAGPADQEIEPQAEETLTRVFRTLGLPTVIHRNAATLSARLEAERALNSTDLFNSAIEGMYQSRSEFVSTSQHLIALLLALIGGAGVSLMAAFKGEGQVSLLPWVAMSLFALAVFGVFLSKIKLRAGYDLYVAACSHATCVALALRLPLTHHWLEHSVRNASRKGAFGWRWFRAYVTFRMNDNGRHPRDMAELCAVWRCERGNLYLMYRAYAIAIGLLALSGLGLSLYQSQQPPPAKQLNSGCVQISAPTAVGQPPAVIPALTSQSQPVLAPKPPQQAWPPANLYGPF